MQWFIFLLLLLWSHLAHAAVVGSGLTGAGVAGGACDAADTIQTASIAPTANALIIACITTEVTSGTAPTVTMTGNGLTWEVVQTQLAETSLLRTTMLRALGASPSSGVATIVPATNSTSGCTWAIGQFTGTDTSGTNGSGAIVQSKGNTASSATELIVTMDNAFSAANNSAIGCFSNPANAALTPGTGFSTVQTNATGTTSRSYLVSDANDTTVDVTAATTSLVGVAAEIKEAVVSSTTRRKWAPRILQLFAPIPLATVGTR